MLMVDLEKKIIKKLRLSSSYTTEVFADMEKLLKLKIHLPLVEDAAHGFMAKHKNKYLGTYGDISLLVFMLQKYYGSQCGATKTIKYIANADIILDKGTDRKD